MKTQKINKHIDFEGIWNEVNIEECIKDIKINILSNDDYDPEYNEICNEQLDKIDRFLNLKNDYYFDKEESKLVTDYDGSPGFEMSFYKNKNVDSSIYYIKVMVNSLLEIEEILFNESPLNYGYVY